MNLLQLLLIKPSNCGDVDKLGEVAYITPNTFNEVLVGLFKVMFSHLTNGEIQITKKKWYSEIRMLCEMHSWGWQIFDKEGNLLDQQLYESN